MDLLVDKITSYSPFINIGIGSLATFLLILFFRYFRISGFQLWFFNIELKKYRKKVEKSDDTLLFSNEKLPFNPYKIIKKYFRSYSSYVILKYGSSVRNNTDETNDIDYIVLLIGTPTTKEQQILHTGNVPVYSKTKTLNIDIVFRDYYSFLCGVVAGMPYENSVLQWSNIIYGHKGYYRWLKAIAKNILIDRDYVIKLLNQRIEEGDLKLTKLNPEIEFYDLVRFGYYHLCNYMQVIKLKEMDKKLRTIDVSRLGLISEFSNVFTNPEHQQLFLQLVAYLKRKHLPVQEDELRKNIIVLRDDLRRKYEK